MILKERQCPVSCSTEAYRVPALCQTFYKGEKSDISHVLTWLLSIPKCPRARCHVLRGGGRVMASKCSLLAGDMGEVSNWCDPKIP